MMFIIMNQIIKIQKGADNRIQVNMPFNPVFVGCKVTKFVKNIELHQFSQSCNIRNTSSMNELYEIRLGGFTKDLKTNEEYYNERLKKYDIW